MVFSRKFLKRRKNAKKIFENDGDNKKSCIFAAELQVIGA